MAAQDPGIHPPTYRLPASAHVGTVRLAVSNLASSLAFYRDIIGLYIIESSGSLASLTAHGDTDVLLELEELPGLQPIGRRTRLGLYHTAFLLPTRQHLSNFVAHLRARNVYFGAGDHLYSEALYLTDPDGLQVEVYADRPRSTWTYEQKPQGLELAGATNPVRFETLPLPTPWHGAPSGTTVGHIHLYIGDLDQAAAFYHAALGFDIVTWRYPGAYFVSAGGYHHHVGLNIWAAGSPVAGPEDPRLLFWQLVFSSQAEIDQAAASLKQAGYQPTGEDTFTDPWGIKVSLTKK